MLDYLFHIIHLTVIVINLTFWMSFKTLRIAQVTQVVTLLSWLGGGLFYGFGYCFLTEWHWDYKRSMGDTDLPASYIKLVLDRSTGQSWDAQLIDQATWIALLISITGCLVQSIRHYRAQVKPS